MASELAKGCHELIESLGLEFKKVYPKKYYEILSVNRKEDAQADLYEWFNSP